MPPAEPWTAERAREFFDYPSQPWEYAHFCDFCGARFAAEALRNEVIATRDRYGFPITHSRCWSCGLVSQSPRLTPAGLRALYSGPYRALVSAWHGRPINAETLEPEQDAYAMSLGRTLREARLPEKPQPRVLDLGGSTGMVAGVVGWWMGSESVTIVEPCVAEATVAVQRAYNGRVVVQSAEDFEPGEERWDLILLCQTVDHLRSISAVLRKVRTWLAPGGRFFVDAVDSERIPEAERYKIDHIYALTPATMRRYLETAGFVAREVEAPSPNHAAFLCEVKA
jgi:SAM-dependent methyltransferase